MTLFSANKTASDKDGPVRRSGTQATYVKRTVPEERGEFAPRPFWIEVQGLLEPFPLPAPTARVDKECFGQHRVEERVGERYVIGVVCAYLQDVEDAVGLPPDKCGRVACAVGERGRVRRSPMPWRGDPIARSCRRRLRTFQFDRLHAR